VELTLIVVALLAAVAGLVVAAAYALRAAAGHWHGLAAAGWRAACPPGRRPRARWEPLAGLVPRRMDRRHPVGAAQPVSASRVTNE
jgi:hypothetical protein